MIIQFPTINNSNTPVNAPLYNQPYDSYPKITWFDKAVEEFKKRQADHEGDGDWDDIA